MAGIATLILPNKVTYNRPVTLPLRSPSPIESENLHPQPLKNKWGWVSAWGEPMRASGTVWTRLHSTQDLGHGTRANSTHVQVWNLIWSRIATKYRPRSHWIGTFAGFAFPQQESVPGWWWLRYTYAKPTWISWIGNLVGDLHDMAARISQRYEFGLLHVKGTID